MSLSSLAAEAMWKQQELRPAPRPWLLLLWSVRGVKFSAGWRATQESCLGSSYQGTPKKFGSVWWLPACPQPEWQVASGQPLAPTDLWQPRLPTQLPNLKTDLGGLGRLGHITGNDGL